MSEKRKTTFDEWLAEIDRIARLRIHGDDTTKSSYTTHTGKERWRDAFNDDVSPQDAWTRETLSWEA
jgi:hypothetical protein